MTGTEKAWQPKGPRLGLWALLGSSWGILGRHDENAYGFMYVHHDFGLVLGAPWSLWDPLCYLLGFLSAFVEFLGNLLGSSLGSFMAHLFFNIQFIVLYDAFERSAYFLSGNTKIEHPQASCGLLGASWEPLGGSWDPLKASWKHHGALLGAMLAPWRPSKRKR